jgi:hypothetical protein
MMEEPGHGTCHIIGKKAELDKLWGMNMDQESRVTAI